MSRRREPSFDGSIANDGNEIAPPHRSSLRSRRHSNTSPEWECLVRHGKVARPCPSWVSMLSKKSFLIDRRNFSGPLARSARRDVRDKSFHTKTTTDRAIGPTEPCSSENIEIRLSRDFRSSSIFDFFDTIGQTRKCPCLHGTSVVPSRADVVRPPRQVRFPTLRAFPSIVGLTQCREIEVLSRERVRPSLGDPASGTSHTA